MDAIPTQYAQLADMIGYITKFIILYMIKKLRIYSGYIISLCNVGI